MDWPTALADEIARCTASRDRHVRLATETDDPFERNRHEWTATRLETRRAGLLAIADRRTSHHNPL